MEIKKVDGLSDKVTSEQAWIGKLQLNNGDFYVQDCSATLVSAFT